MAWCTGCYIQFEPDGTSGSWCHGCRQAMDRFVRGFHERPTPKPKTKVRRGKDGNPLKKHKKTAWDWLKEPAI